MAVGSSGVSNFAYINSGQATGVSAVSGVSSPTVIVGYGPTPPPPSTGDYIITEAGDFILTEIGDYLITESAPVPIGNFLNIVVTP